MAVIVLLAISCEIVVNNGKSKKELLLVTPNIEGGDENKVMTN
jgi:hypothetical protein